MLAAYAVLMIRGGKLYFRAQSAAFVLGTAALAAVVIAACCSRGPARWRTSTRPGAHRAGPVAPLAAGQAPGFSWSATLHAAIWPWIVFVGCYFSVFIAGEVRRPARTQAIGVLGSTTWALAWLLGVTFALSHLFGMTFFANLAFTPPAKLGLASTPAFAELVALALHHGVLAVALMAAFTVWGFAWVGPTAMCVSRCLFAWSLDGLAPGWCAEVHRRWHTPYRALLLTFAVATVFTALMIYAHLSLLSGMIVMFIEWLCVAAVAIVLPRVAGRRGFMLPPARRFAGLSSLSWLGVLTMPPVLVAAWLNLTDANSGTSIAHQPKALLLWVAILAGCLAIYRVVAGVRERRGTSLTWRCGCCRPTEERRRIPTAGLKHYVYGDNPDKTWIGLRGRRPARHHQGGYAHEPQSRRLPRKLGRPGHSHRAAGGRRADGLGPRLHRPSGPQPARVAEDLLPAQGQPGNGGAQFVAMRSTPASSSPPAPRRRSMPTTSSPYT